MTIPLSILLPNGDTITPPGWMWTLALALKGVPWATEEMDTPKMRELVRNNLSANDLAELTVTISNQG